MPFWTYSSRWLHKCVCVFVVLDFAMQRTSFSQTAAKLNLKKFMRSWNLEETFALIKDLLADEARFSHAAVPRSCWLSRLIPACLLKLIKLGAGITNETDPLSHVGLRRKINTRPNNSKEQSREWLTALLFFPIRVFKMALSSHFCPPAPQSHFTLLWRQIQTATSWLLQYLAGRTQACFGEITSEVSVKPRF